MDNYCSWCDYGYDSEDDCTCEDDCGANGCQGEFSEQLEEC